MATWSRICRYGTAAAIEAGTSPPATTPRTRCPTETARTRDPTTAAPHQVAQRHSLLEPARQPAVTPAVAFRAGAWT